MAHPKHTSYKTTCSYCGVGCGIIIHKSPSGKLRLEGDKDNPVNRGMLCSKGRNLLYVTENQSDRLLKPQIREKITDKLEDTNWDNALTKIADKVKDTIEKHGADSIGFYVSGQCLTEEYYVANKLVKGFIGTNNIDTNSRLCMSSAVMGYKMALGDDTVPASYDDIELADCFLISGANPAWCHPILFRRLENHKEKNPNTKFIVIDPRVTDTESIADLHLQLKPGTDIELTNAIAKCLIEDDLIDNAFIHNHTNGFETLVKDLKRVDLNKAAEICDVPLQQIKEAAQIIGKSKAFMSLWAMGLNQSSEGVNKNLSLLNLSLLTGMIGKPGSGPLSLTGQPNAMGGREVGGMATLLAAHHDLANAEHRNKIQKYWSGKEISGTPGLTATKMVEALEEGKLKVIWVICTNPLVSLPNLMRTEKAFQKAEMVIVQDISSKSDTLDFAHVVLPAAGWLEKEGTMTNSERRISYLNKLVAPPGEAKPDVEILTSFAKEMGFTGFDFENTEEIFDEYKLLTKRTTIDISALTYKNLKQEGAKQWPVTTENPNGTERLFTDNKFYTKDKKAVIHSTVHKSSIESELDLPFTLTTGRIRDQWHTMTRTGKVQKLNVHIDKPTLSINTIDASERNINEGDLVKIHNHRGSVEVVAQIDPTLKSGVVFLPMHWGKVVNSIAGRANNLTSSAIDPISKQPEYKFAKVEVVKLEKPMNTILIIGAGAAAFSFIEQHRKHNQKDKILVFSKEDNAFYNRVQLPGYINDNKEWSNLQKANKAEIEAFNIELHTNTSIEKINTAKKQVIDINGVTHNYTKLIIATGSKAYTPEGAPIHLPGVFTVRTRYDADKIKNYIKQNKAENAVVIGGGILGLEMADSLNDFGLTTTLLVRGNKLMSKQLDETAAKLLARQIFEKGINLKMNTSLQETELVNNNRKILKYNTGENQTTDLVIFAIGTNPEVTIAQKASLNCHKGVVVNEFMQTSVPEVFAIGEIAEFNNQLHGITRAAEEQAKACANFFAGNYFEHYKSSISVNILKCSNVKLCTIGEVNTDDFEVEEVILLDEKKNYYKKCLVKNDILVGAILMGDVSEQSRFIDLIDSQTELGDDRETLLRNTEKSEPILGKLVCSCNQVGRGNIENFIQQGHSDFEGLMLASKAGTGCGSCKPELKKILSETLVTK